MPDRPCDFVPLVLVIALAPGCTGGPAQRNAPSRPTIFYVGSSTVANFLREAEPVYGRAVFNLDTVPESRGGERAMQEGNARLAGIAFEPSDETRDMGIRTVNLGTDAIAIVVNAENPVTGLTMAQLKAVFTGQVASWKEIGGPDLPVVPCVVGEESATRRVFRDAVLGGAEYGRVKVVQPDADIPMTVEAEPGGIGTISTSFLCSGGMVRVLKVDGQIALPDNADYPIARPLYLLWRAGDLAIEEFIAWLTTPEADAVLTKCFGRPRPLHSRAARG